MITASIKTTRKRIIGTLCIILAFIIAVIMFFAEEKPKEEKKPFTNEDFLDFVESFGWETKDDSVSKEIIELPKEPDEVLQKYSELQAEAGYDLAPHFGSRTEKYTCKITNFEDSEEIYASAYVCEGKIIAADISSHGEGWQTSIDGKVNKRYYLESE